MAEGTVKWFNDSKGFFDFRRKCDAFVHHTSIQGNGCKSVGHATGGVGGMSRSRRIGFTALLAVGVLFIVLVAPAVAFAGEPVEGAEVFLEQEPGDDPNPECNPDCPPINNGQAGGSWELGPYGSFTVPAGATNTPAHLTCTLYWLSPPRGHRTGASCTWPRIWSLTLSSSRSR